MTTSAARRHARRAGRTGKSAGRQAAHSPALRWLARAGLAARGVLYLIIGWIAIQVAFGQSSHQADQTGALRLLGRNPAGEVALWLLVIGFAGMCLWRVTEAIYGASGSGQDKATDRLAALGRALVYGFITFGVLKYAVGLGAPKSSDQQSVDLTATVMSHPGGRVAVIIVPEEAEHRRDEPAHADGRDLAGPTGRSGPRRDIRRRRDLPHPRRRRGQAQSGQGTRHGAAGLDPHPSRPVAAAGDGHRPDHVRRLFLLRGPLAPRPAPGFLAGLFCFGLFCCRLFRFGFFPAGFFPAGLFPADIFPLAPFPCARS
jgi:hypothetical protein